MSHQQKKQARRASGFLRTKRTIISVMSFLLIVGAMGGVVTTSSPASAAPSAARPARFLRQAEPTPAPTELKVTLKEMGYSERTLASPWESVQYSLKLPDNWQIEQGSYLELEFSYSFTDLATRGGAPAATFYGQLSSFIDNQLLDTYSLEVASLDHTRWRIDLPADLLNERPGAYHDIRLELDAWFMCDLPHKAQLVVHPESILFLDYTVLPPSLDLAEYPRPFERPSFEPSQVRFVLPAQPSELELRAAAAVAAGMGSLTSNKMVISTTADVDWLKAVTADPKNSEQLVVIGQPGRNQLAAWLGANTALPIQMRRRELAVSTQGPAVIAPGDVLTLTITVTNTTQAAVDSLSITDQLPNQTSVAGCQPECVKTGQAASWKLVSLAPGEAAVMSLALQVAGAEQLASPAAVLENTAVLANQAQSPVNVSSLTVPIGSATPETTAPYSRDDFFFVQNEQPVPEGDGILQEIMSPWDPQQTVLLVTGVSQAAVYKAGQSLALKTRLPDMKGPAALVRQITTTGAITRTVETAPTLESLGYENATLYGVSSQELVYWFYVPYGWQLTKDAYLRLLFSHSRVIDERNSTMTVMVNDTPLTTTFLDQANAEAGSLQISLAGAGIRPGATNKMSVQVLMQPNQYRCDTISPRQAWFKIWQDSSFQLDHQIQSTSELDLGNFPFPFNVQLDLGNVLFVVPPVARQNEQEALLRLAAVLGDATRGSALIPVVSFGDSLDPQRLSGYHIIAIGRPTLNPLLQEINSELPQPFMPGSDQVQYQVGSVLLRLPPDTSLGYVQLLESPWNPRQAVVAVTGTTDEATAWAAEVLTRQPWRLSGNLALIRSGKKELEVQVVDTRKLTSAGLASTMATAAPQLSPVATLGPETGAGSSGLPSSPTPPAGAQGKGGFPTWVLVFSVVTAAVALIILFAGIARLVRQKR